MIVLSRFFGKFENLIQTVGLPTSFTAFSGDSKKKKKKALKMKKKALKINWSFSELFY